MPVKFHLPPAKTYRAAPDNPAECIATTGNLEFGLTIPKVNGTLITGLQEHDVTAPTVQTTVAPVVVGTETFNARARVTNVVDYNIAWPMSLPPIPVNGMWTSATKISGRDLQERLKIIFASRAQVGKPLNPSFDFKTNPKLISARNMYTVYVKPLPSAQDFMNHIEFHECQHVADHRWLAERIIGWWDNWLHDLMTKNIDIVTKGGLTDLAVATGFGYAVGLWRIIKYWCRAAAQSGDLYHETPEGARPVLNISDITDKSITITVTPRQIIRQKPDLQIVKPHADMVFKTSSLNGVEPALTHGAPPTNPFKDSD